MSVLTYLEKVASTLVLTGAENQSICRSLSTLETRLALFDEKSEIKTSYIFGSYDRNTILPRQYDYHSDVDYMIVFKDAFKVNPESRLRWLQKFANTKYSTSEVHRDYPTIALELNHIRFELVPAVEMGSSINLQIPAPKSQYLSWIYTNPSQLALQSLDANRRISYKFKPLVRILKLWNVRNGRPFSSYELEQQLAQLIFYSGNNLEDYLYYAVNWLTAPFMSETNKKKVERLKQQIQTAQTYKKIGSEAAAENIVQSLFPL